MADAIPVIQATLAPAFLLSGVGIMLNFMQARLFRVIDRSRAEPSGPSPLQRHRIRLLRNGVALGVLTIFFTVVTAMCLLLASLAGLSSLLRAAPVTFALAMLSLLVAMCLVLYDTVLSVRSVERRV